MCAILWTSGVSILAMGFENVCMRKAGILSLVVAVESLMLRSRLCICSGFGVNCKCKAVGSGSMLGSDCMMSCWIRWRGVGIPPSTFAKWLEMATSISC